MAELSSERLTALPLRSSRRRRCSDAALMEEEFIMLSRKYKIIRFPLIFLCLMALLGVQLPGGIVSHKAKAQSQRATAPSVQPEVTFTCTNCPISAPSTFPAPTAAT